MNTNLDEHHEHIAAVVLATLVGLAALGGLLNAAVSATGHPVLVSVTLAAPAVTVVAVRWVARRVRERREDAADALAAAAWRAEHLPHPTAVLHGDGTCTRTGGGCDQSGERSGLA